MIRRSSRTPRRPRCCTCSACKVGWAKLPGTAIMIGRICAILPTRLHREVRARGQRARTLRRLVQGWRTGALPTLQVGLLTLALAILPARAQAPDLGEIHGLKLGLKAPSMTMDGFGELSCGSNGGPPRQRIDDWASFGKCRAEPSGLHEVYARFDDEDEFVGRAIDDPLYAGSRTGTRVAGHPVILSVLFDDAGVLRGLRFISDPRAAPTEPRMAHLLRLAIINHYDPAGWTCMDLPAENGETPVGGIFIH